ncbi:MAG: hypothetical protein E6J46_05285 [Chloroflexi bacterium]|nr:MAG: hypothetical protein E6J46_05285 [Chloroflexota bacterium]
MSKEQTRPSESLVQDLLAERRELKVAVERLKLDLADAQANAGSFVKSATSFERASSVRSSDWPPSKRKGPA